MLKGSQQIVRSLFGLPDEENVLDDFSCAWQRDIKLHGRLFCTDRSLCFYAELLGYSTKLVIPFKEVLSLRKDKTAFSRGVAVECTNSRHYIFGAFQRSSATFQFLLKVWRSLGGEEEDAGHWSDEALALEEDEGTMLAGDEDPLRVLRKLVLTMTPQDFFNAFLADSASFSFSQVWTQLGYALIRCAAWNEQGRLATYRIAYDSGLFVGDSSRQREEQHYELDAKKLVLYFITKAEDTPYYSHYYVEQEWTVTRISNSRSLLRCGACVKFTRATKMKRQLTDYVMQEVERGTAVWTREFVARGLIPDALVQTTEMASHKLVRYEEVDLKKVQERRRCSVSDVVLVLNAGVLGLAVAFLLSLHFQVNSPTTCL